MMEGIRVPEEGELCPICHEPLDEDFHVLVAIPKDKDLSQYEVMGFVCSNCVADQTGGG